MRTVLRGLLVGAFLSLLRAPRGLDLLELPATSASSALLVRAAGFVLAGVVLLAALRRPGVLLLLATAAGYALHGLVLTAWIQPSGSWSLALTFVVGVILALAAALDERRLDEPLEPPHENRAAFVGELIGLFVAGAGAALPQDTLTIATNPAGLVAVGHRSDIGVELFVPDREAYIRGNAFGPDQRFDGNGTEYFLIPELGHSHLVCDDLAVGFAVYGNGGMNTDYGGGEVSAASAASAQTIR